MRVPRARDAFLVVQFFLFLVGLPLTVMEVLFTFLGIPPEENALESFPLILAIITFFYNGVEFVVFGRWGVIAS